MTPFCLMESFSCESDLGSLNCTYLFSLLSLRSLKKREGNDSVRLKSQATCSPDSLQGKRGATNRLSSGTHQALWKKTHVSAGGSIRVTRLVGLRQILGFEEFLRLSQSPVGRDCLCPTHLRWSALICQASVGGASCCLFPSLIPPATDISWEAWVLGCFSPKDPVSCTWDLRRPQHSLPPAVLATKPERLGDMGGTDTF